jgi:hypothetical protein
MTISDAEKLTDTITDFFINKDWHQKFLKGQEKYRPQVDIFSLNLVLKDVCGYLTQNEDHPLVYELKALESKPIDECFNFEQLIAHADKASEYLKAQALKPKEYSCGISSNL